MRIPLHPTSACLIHLLFLLSSFHSPTFARPLVSSVLVYSLFSFRAGYFSIASFLHLPFESELASLHHLSYRCGRNILRQYSHRTSRRVCSSISSGLISSSVAIFRSQSVSSSNGNIGQVCKREGKPKIAIQPTLIARLRTPATRHAGMPAFAATDQLLELARLPWRYPRLRSSPWLYCGLESPRGHATNRHTLPSTIKYWIQHKTNSACTDNQHFASSPASIKSQLLYLGIWRTPKACVILRSCQIESAVL